MVSAFTWTDVAPRAGVGHRLEHGALLLRIALDRLHEIGNEIGFAADTDSHVRPFCLGLFLIGRDIIDAAPG